MIYSDTHKVAFVAIPKNANTSARDIFSERIGDDFFSFTRDKPEHIKRIIDDNDYSFNMNFHYGHLPLWALKEEFPSFFNQLKTWELFAIIRDPFDRFPSSFTQYLAQDEIKTDISKLNKYKLEKALNKLMDELMSTGVNYQEKTVFIPQCDYIYVDGKQIVKNLFDVKAVNEFKYAFEKKCNLKFGEFEHLNANRRTVSVPEFPMKSIVRKVLPKSVKQYIKNMLDSNFQVRNKFREIFDKSNVIDFIEDFYQKDIDMYAKNKNN